MHAKAQPAQRYRAYLVRCWQETQEMEDTCIWRFSLERVGDSEERAGFATLEELCATLMEEMDIRSHDGRLQQGRHERGADHRAGRHSAWLPDCTSDYTLDSG